MGLNEKFFTTAASPESYFETVLWDGNGATTRSITGVGFDPDLVWVKKRSGGTAGNHSLYDVVRGAGERLNSNNSSIETTVTNGVKSFINDGFTIGNGDEVNGSGSSQKYVAWCFKAGGAAVSNTDGGINSNVSVNNDLGFSIVSYAGNSTVGATVGHGLNSTPEMIIVKRLSGIENWAVYTAYSHPTVPENYLLTLDNNSFAGLNSTRWNNTSPTPTLFSLGTSQAVNSSSNNYIAYCFASKTGFSKLGSYTGTGNNMTVNVGFEPAFVFIKNTSSAASWHIFDNKRTTANPSTAALFPNEDIDEADYNGVFEFTSTGFRNLIQTTSLNKPNDVYVYYAIAV